MLNNLPFKNYKTFKKGKNNICGILQFARIIPRLSYRHSTSISDNCVSESIHWLGGLNNGLSSRTVRNSMSSNLAIIPLVVWCSSNVEMVSWYFFIFGTVQCWSVLSLIKYVLCLYTKKRAVPYIGPYLVSGKRPSPNDFRFMKKWSINHTFRNN